VKETTEILKKAIMHKGFSVVELLSQCPTHYGRKNKEGDAASMLELQKSGTAKIGSKALEKNPGLTPRGIFVDTDKPEYCEEYDKIIAHATKENIS
jgi:2-oxoglutarate ferredoxin oxidoreductase subunit beta